MKYIIPRKLIKEVTDLIRDESNMDFNSMRLTSNMSKEGALFIVENEYKNGFPSCKRCKCKDTYDCVFYNIRNFVNNLDEADKVVLKIKGINA